MWELFWFVLGALIYSFLSLAMRVSDKAEFVKDIKIIAFKLICSAFEDLVYARSLKYKAILDDEFFDEEKLKILKNEDEGYILRWKKETVINLQQSVPTLYKNSLDVESWESLMSFLETYHRKTILSKTEKENEA